MPTDGVVVEARAMPRSPGRAKEGMLEVVGDIDLNGAKTGKVRSLSQIFSLETQNGAAGELSPENYALPFLCSLPGRLSGVSLHHC